MVYSRAFLVVGRVYFAVTADLSGGGTFADLAGATYYVGFGSSAQRRRPLPRLVYDTPYHRCQCVLQNLEPCQDGTVDEPC